MIKLNGEQLSTVNHLLSTGLRPGMSWV